MVQTPPVTTVILPEAHIFYGNPISTVSSSNFDGFFCISSPRSGQNLLIDSLGDKAIILHPFSHPVTSFMGSEVENSGLLDSGGIVGAGKIHCSGEAVNFQGKRREILPLSTS